MSDIFDAIVLGGGAAGLMCALTAGQRGKRVLVIEKSNKLAKKILMSGGGRCNFTNLYISADNYVCPNPHFVKSALKQYTQWDFIDLVERHGIAYHEKKHGQLFCDNSAKDILNILIAECDRGKVKSICDTEISEIDRSGDNYFLKSERGCFQTRNLIVATGGLSIPTLGGSGFAYEYASRRGFKVCLLYTSDAADD